MNPPFLFGQKNLLPTRPLASPLSLFLSPFSPIFAILLCLLAILPAGCASFIVPQEGMVARPESRIALVDKGEVSGIWASRDFTLEYRLLLSADTLTLSGPLTLAPAVNNSFPVVRSLFFRLNFLDSAGRVLASSDITPLYGIYNNYDNPTTLSIRRPRPPGSVAIAFNYYGVFRGRFEAMGGDELTVSHFPFD